MATKVEVFNSVSQNTCSLEDLPIPRTGHSMCGGLLCGHNNFNRRTCLIWDADTKKFSRVSRKLRLLTEYSLCWAVDDYGILLLGGSIVFSTRTEYVLYDGSDSCESFQLKKRAE